MTRFEFYLNLNRYKDKQDEKSEENSLKHYGTLGQKWGQRKWQNYDGTFNEAGKERYFGKNGTTKIGSFINDSVNKSISEVHEAKEKGIGSLLYQNLDGTLTKKGQKLLKKYRNGNEKAAGKINDLINLDLYEKTVAEPINIKKISKDLDLYDVNSGADSSLKDYQLSKYMSKKQVDRAMKHRDLLEEIANTMYSEATAENILKFRDQINTIEDKKEKDAVIHAMASMMTQMKHTNDGEGYNFRFEGKFGSQPGADKAKEEADTELFSKKNENGRSETADKMEEAAKKLRDDGDDETAQKIEDTSKEIRDATSVTPDRKNMTKEEKKELRRAANNCWKTVNKGAWVSWFLFGLPGYAINSAVNWALIKETATRIGLEGKSKTWSASDWDKITNTIMDRYPRKYKKEIAKRDAAANQE